MSGWLGARPWSDTNGANARAEAPVPADAFRAAPVNFAGRDDDETPDQWRPYAWRNGRAVLREHRANDGGVHADCPSCQAQVWSVATGELQ